MLLVNTGKSYLSIALIWAYSIFWVTGPFAGFGKNIPEATLETCSYDFLTNDKEVSALTNETSIKSYSIGDS